MLNTRCHVITHLSQKEVVRVCPLSIRNSANHRGLRLNLSPVSPSAITLITTKQTPNSEPTTPHLTMGKSDKLGENDKPDWSGPTAAKFDKYVRLPLSPYTHTRSMHLLIAPTTTTNHNSQTSDQIR